MTLEVFVIKIKEHEISLKSIIFTLKVNEKQMKKVTESSNLIALDIAEKLDQEIQTHNRLIDLVLVSNYKNNKIIHSFLFNPMNNSFGILFNFIIYFGFLGLPSGCRPCLKILIQSSSPEFRI